MGIIKLTNIRTFSYHGCLEEEAKIGSNYRVDLTIKTNLKNYLKRSDSPFKDVDFEGSNVNQLLDVLSYNTYLNSYYLNIIIIISLIFYLVILVTK